MDKMIVTIDYTDAGERYISKIIYNRRWTEQDLMIRASVFSKTHDETYIVSFDNNCIPFIDEIVLHGCRIGV